MVEDTYLDVNYVDSMDIEYWNAGNASTDRSSATKMLHNSKIFSLSLKHTILIFYRPLYHRITQLGILTAEQHTTLPMMLKI